MDKDKKVTILGDGTKVILDGEKCCPHCKETKPLSEFGARRMETGEIRVQPWCRKCR